MAERKAARKPTKRKRRPTASTRPKKRKVTSKPATTRPRKRTTARKTTSRSRLSLSSDLKKYADEAYATGELLRGGVLLVEREGTDAIREAVMAFLASQVPLFGGQLGQEAVAGLVRKLNDDYRKLGVDDRKALRAILNWLSGAHKVDAETASRLLTELQSPPKLTE